MATSDDDSSAPPSPGVPETTKAGHYTRAELDEARREMEQQKLSDTVDRYKFLLGQTELFAHFISAKGLQVAEEELASKKASKAKASAGRRGGNRKTEKEEDEELLNDELEEDAAPLSTETVFTESPQYVNGKLREYQIHGLNWLISLFEHGINGVLADEMGLVCY